MNGRGGASFPLSEKRSAVGVAAGTGPVVVVNWCEGDPTADKDRALAEQAPHLVLDGAIAAAGIEFLVVPAGGGCAHPDGAVALAGSALGALLGPLRSHLDGHLRHGPCGAPTWIPLGGTR